MNREPPPSIVHVVNSLHGGGTERTLVALLRVFNPFRFRHAVVTLRTAGPLAARLPDHVACQPLNARGRCWFTALGLAKLTRRHKAALIHARNTGCWGDAIVAGLLTPRAQVVLGFHGLESADHFSRRQRRVARLALLTGARFTSVSETGRRMLIEQAGVPADRIDLLRNGVAWGFFGRSDDAARHRVRADLGIDDKAFVVGIVGSLTPVKRHATLISVVARAARSVSNIVLLIVGDGPLRASLVRQAEENGVPDRIRFTGWREDVAALMGCMDAYVCSSSSEGMNNALLEAMTAGLPIIATDAGDNAMLVRHNVEGFIIGADLPDALAGSLVLLANSPELRRRFGAAARNRARNYSFDRTVWAYETYYESLISPNASDASTEPVVAHDCGAAVQAPPPTCGRVAL